MRYSTLTIMILLTTGCATVPDPELGTASAERLHELSIAYHESSYQKWRDSFALDATWDGRPVADMQEHWEFYFGGMEGQPMDYTFFDVQLDGNIASAWSVEKGDTRCDGPAVYRFNLDGLISSVENACVDVELGDSYVDHATMGQSADIASTVAIQAAPGLVEANPLINGIGLAPVALLKIGMSEYAETKPMHECVMQKGISSSLGYGAAAWNACLLLGPGAAGCLVAGGFAAWYGWSGTGDSNTMACWQRLDDPAETYAKIDFTGAYQ